MMKFLSTKIQISDKEYDLFIAKAKVVHYRKSELLISANRFVNKLFFIKKGFVRGYRLVNGVDMTHHFFIENQFATDYEGYLTGKIGHLYLEAIIDTTVYEFDKSTLLLFYETHHKFEKIRAIQAEGAYLQMVERLKSFQTKDLTDRYQNFILKNQKLFDLIPQKHIASYLGVTPQSLSRIKEIIKNA